MKVLSATGMENLDQELLNILPQYGMEPAGTCFNRDVLAKVAQELQADTLIVSPMLDGSSDLVQVLSGLSKKGLRVLVLPGDPQMKNTQELITQLVPWGIYDYCYDPIEIKNIVERLQRPAVLEEIPKSLVNAAMSKQKIGEKIKQEIKRKLPEEKVKPSIKGKILKVASSLFIRKKEDDNGQNLNEEIPEESTIVEIASKTGESENHKSPPIRNAAPSNIPPPRPETYLPQEPLTDNGQISELKKQNNASQSGFSDENQKQVIEVTSKETDQDKEKALELDKSLQDHPTADVEDSSYKLDTEPTPSNLKVEQTTLNKPKGQPVSNSPKFEPSKSRIKSKIEFKKPDVKGFISKLSFLPKTEIPNLITVWSPVSAGRTFNSVNLAAAYCIKGYRTVLVSSKAATTWFSLSNKVPVLDGSFNGLLPVEIPGLVVLDKAKGNEFNKLADKADIVIVDGQQETLSFSGQIMLVVNLKNLDQIESYLNKVELEWNKVWVIANGVQASEVRKIEASIKLKVDFLVPYNMTGDNLVAMARGTYIAELFKTAATGLI